MKVFLCLLFAVLAISVIPSVTAERIIGLAENKNPPCERWPLNPDFWCTADGRCYVNATEPQSPEKSPIKFTVLDRNSNTPHIEFGIEDVRVPSVDIYSLMDTYVPASHWNQSNENLIDAIQTIFDSIENGVNAGFDTLRHLQDPRNREFVRSLVKALLVENRQYVKQATIVILEANKDYIDLDLQRALMQTPMNTTTIERYLDLYTFDHVWHNLDMLNTRYAVGDLGFISAFSFVRPQLREYHERVYGVLEDLLAEGLTGLITGRIDDRFLEIAVLPMLQAVSDNSNDIIRLAVSNDFTKDLSKVW